MKLEVVTKHRNIIKESKLNIHQHNETCEICQHISPKISQTIINDNGYKLTLSCCNNCFEMISVLILTRIKNEFNGSFKTFCLKTREYNDQLDWYSNTIPFRKTIKFNFKLPQYYYNLEITKPNKHSYHLKLHTLNDNTTVCLYCGELLHNGGMVSNEHIIPKSHHKNEENTIFGDTCHECNRLRRSYDLYKILRHDHWLLRYFKLSCGGHSNRDLTHFIKSNNPMLWMYFRQSFY